MAESIGLSPLEQEHFKTLKLPSMDLFRSIARFVDYELQHSFSSGFDKSTQKRFAFLFTKNNNLSSIFFLFFKREKRALNQQLGL